MMQNADGEKVPLERSFQWYIHNCVLTHKVFTMQYGGFKAVAQGVKIAGLVDGVEPGKAVMFDSDLVRLMKMPLDAPKKDEKKPSEENKMAFLEASMLFPHMEAIMDDYPKDPTLPTEEKAEEPTSSEEEGAE